MGKQKQPRPLGQVQLEVLQYISDHYPVRVSDVAEHFAKAGKARTTILTVMEKLREKGYLTRKKRNGAFHYAPRQSKSDLMTAVVHRFVQDSLGGSVSPVISYLADARGLNQSELTKLRELVASLEAGNRDSK